MIASTIRPLILTAVEERIVEKLPQPPATTTIRATNVWIIEWLPKNDQRTGLRLHEWMRDRRKGWSAYSACRSKSEVLQSIDNATKHAERMGSSPVLHIEAHGDMGGLEGPTAHGGRERLTWNELIGPLQRLNVATRCNLVLIVAACVGFAGIGALTSGPRAPAMALVGPTALVTPKALLEGSKELYRRWQDDNPTLDDIATSANQQAGTVFFEIEPFTALAYESFVRTLIVSLRPDEQQRRKERLRSCMVAETTFSIEDIARRLATMPRLGPTQGLQQMWDRMFMIDLYPDNVARFGLDVASMVALLTGEH